MSAIVKCENVSIRYITGDFKDIGLKEYLIRKITGSYSVTEFWADRHVTFELESGDMLGIIGSNGAGKSTLLKAISGIMVPTEGTVTCNAKISALLELASGFDGDLTVRENTYLRAAMLGYSREFVDATYDSIIEFAELQDFQERPFKQLSSGMKSRLAFSIASLVNPEILILDEVLSVGDGAFRKKSEAKMRQIIGGGATTILVSHSVGQVRSLCNKILWLHHGEQVAFGNNVKGLCDAYEKYLSSGKIPSTAELSPMNVDVPPVSVASSEIKSAGPLPPTIAADGVPAGQDEEDTPHSRVRPGLLARIRQLPKAVAITIIVMLLLTGVIAIDEARLPGIVHALPQGSRLMYQDAQGLQVCVWDGRMYVFVPAGADVQGQTFAVRATTNRGAVSTQTYTLSDLRPSRYDTAEMDVLEINLAMFPGYVKLEYGVVSSGNAASDVDGQFAWEWFATYEK